MKKEKTIMTIIARMGSTRLPGKVLMNLAGRPVLSWVVSAGYKAHLIDKVIVATTTDPRDDAIVKWCEDNHVSYHRGPEDDVLSRVLGAAIKFSANVVVRVTADCPLIDPAVIDQVVALREATDADYASNIDPPTWPDGLDCESIDMEALLVTNKEAESKIDRECVTTYIQRNKYGFDCENLVCPIDLHKERWVLDTESDWQLCQAIAEGADGTSWLQIKRFLDENPELRALNAHHPRNERFFEAIASEPVMPRTYPTSKALLARAEKTIPLAAQTFSKSKIQYPAESPLFITHGDGGYCFDVDGNRYVDLVGGLLPVILGHRDPDVDYAIRRQLNNGISFSLATELEAELAEILCRLIPSAEMVRYGKSGTDVTTAAVRLARAYTGRDLVISSGYHGWADWSVAHDHIRNSGVPEAIRRHNTPLRHGDSASLHNLYDRRDVAAVVLEPETDPEFLKECRKFCDEADAILIFDEIITWPRWGLGGAQSVFNVIPDLTCISKAMGNGMPISALVGKRDIMSHMEKISYSGTFFGETLSIAAAIATIKKLEREKVIGRLSTCANYLGYCVTDMATRFFGLDLRANVIKTTTGFINRHSFGNEDIKTLFIQEMAQAGVLIIASHNLSYAHGENEIKRVLTAYDHTLGVIRDALDRGDIKERIKGRSIPAYANVRA